MAHDYNLIYNSCRCEVQGAILFFAFLGASSDDWGKFTLNVKEGHWIIHIDFVNGIIQIVDSVMYLINRVIQMTQMAQIL